MSWLAEKAEGETPLEQVLGLRPNLHAAFQDFYAVFWQRRLVPPVILELCRLRVAQLLGCASEQNLRYQAALDAGLDEEKVAALPLWGRGDAFDEAERACLALAEMFVQDPHAITDEDADLVLRYLGEEGMVALTEALALFDGFIRFQVLLGVEARSTALRVLPTPCLLTPELLTPDLLTSEPQGAGECP